MRTKTVTFLLLGPAAALSAQSNRVVFPTRLATVEGEYTQGSIPLSGGVQRTQLLFEGHDLALPDNARIQRIGFRQDGATQVASPTFQVRMQILMGPTPVTAVTTSNTFASNYTTPPATVFTVKNVALPMLPAPTPPGPSTTFVTFPLDTPHVYSRSQNLLAEFLVFANSNGSQPFAYYLDQSNGLAIDSAPYGAGCPTSGNRTPALTATGGLLGQYWQVSLTNGPGSQAVGFLLSSRQLNVPLPGAPGCSLYVDLTGALVVPAITSSGGAVYIQAQVPDVLAFDGTNLFAQVGVIDPFANQLGVVTSNGVKTTLNSPPRGAIIYATGSTTAPTGANYRRVVLATSFDY